MSKSYMELIGINPSTRAFAVLEGYQLFFEKEATFNPKQGFANIRAVKEKARVYGIVYDLPEESIAILDKIEDYPTGYTREEVIVTLANGNNVPVITYIATPAMIKEHLLPSREYIQLLSESEDLLPQEYIATLRLLETID